MKFTLEIELGDDAMQSYPDVAWALARLSKRLFENHLDDTPVARDSGIIRDLNGNCVGKWEVVEARSVKVACALTGIGSQDYKVALSLHPVKSDDMEILRGLAIDADDAIVTVREVLLP